GFMLFKAIWSNQTVTTPSAGAPAIPDTPAAGDAESGAPIPAGASPSEAAPSTNPVFSPATALPRPDALVGFWESRVDDGSNSSFVFRADGTVVLKQAGDPPPPPAQYNWFLAERKGDELVLDFGPEFGAIGNTRLTLRMTSPEAFTLIK